MVTGGATGIGRAVALELGRLGCKVAFCWVEMEGRAGELMICDWGTVGIAPLGVPMLAGPGARSDHRSFSVLSPASASTKLTIQKRMTMVGSDQPICSKWWWIGAIRKMRLPVRL